MFNIFANKQQRADDNYEAIMMINKYGDDAITTLQHRIADKNLSKRDRKHWRRILNIIPHVQKLQGNNKL